MDEPRDALHITVEYWTGSEDGIDDVGYPYYTASCEEIVGVTYGRTWNDLMRNIREMVDAALDEPDTVATYALVSNPRIVISMELPENYAEIA